MIGGKGKYSQRWSWGNVRRQTVPEAAASHQKCSIADGGQPCTSNHQLRGWRRPKAAAVGVSDALDVVGKVPWCQTVQASVNEHSQFEIDVFWRPQPVKVLQHWCDVLRFFKRFSKIWLSNFFIVLVFDLQKSNIVSNTALFNCTNL